MRRTTRSNFELRCRRTSPRLVVVTKSELPLQSGQSSYRSEESVLPPTSIVSELEA